VRNTATGGIYSAQRSKIDVGGAADTVHNAGSIGGGSDWSIILVAGGSISNAMPGTISAGGDGLGVFVTRAAGRVVNADKLYGERLAPCDSYGRQRAAPLLAFPTKPQFHSYGRIGKSL